MRPGDSARAMAASLLAAATALLAQLNIRIGPVPYTMQNTGFILSGLLLPPRWALTSQLLYLTMIAVGAPAAAGFKGGPGVLVGPTGGYLAGFPLAALLMSTLRGWYLRRIGKRFAELGARELAMLWLFSALATTPVYALGFLVFSYWASLDPSLPAWALRAAGFFGLAADPRLAVVAASVAIFLPQDLLMDHPLALLTAHRVAHALPNIYDALAGSSTVCARGSAR